MGPVDRAEDAADVNDDHLKQSLLELYEEAPCGYLFTAPNGTILRANRTFLVWTGYAPDELVQARRFADLLTIPGKIFYENQYAPLLRMQGSVREVAFDLVRKDREPLSVLVSSIERRDDAGQPTLVASIVFDATSRRAYERELLRARQEAGQLAAIVEASDDAILSASVDGRIRTWNPGARRLLGRSSADAIGRRLAEVLPVVGRPEWGAMEAKLRGGGTVRIETTALDAGGEGIDVSASLAPLRGPLGELDAITAILRDIRELQAVERLRREFLAMTSHELRNPLASIKGFAQLMRRRGQYSEKGIETILAQAEQLDALVGDLLLASQVAVGRIDLHLEPVDLVAEARAAASAYVDPDAPRVRVVAPAEPVTVSADRRRLRQIFANLIGNALKYSSRGDEVVVAIASSAREARVAVSDRGVGIPPEALPRLFDRFYRVPATAGGAPGLGLGLFITRELVRAHRGEITVESELGRGSMFTVTLPRETEPA